VDTDGRSLWPVLEVLSPVGHVLQMQRGKRLAKVHLQAGGAVGQLEFETRAIKERKILQSWLTSKSGV